MRLQVGCQQGWAVFLKLLFFNPAPLFHRVPLIRDEVIRATPFDGAVADLVYNVEKVTLVIDVVYARGCSTFKSLVLSKMREAACMELVVYRVPRHG